MSLSDLNHGRTIRTGMKTACCLGTGVALLTCLLVLWLQSLEFYSLPHQGHTGSSSVYDADYPRHLDTYTPRIVPTDCQVVHYQ
jgi:hypothetical protein